MPQPARRNGLCLLDVTALLAALVLLFALVVPALGRLRGTSQVDVSLSNLGFLGIAHSLYAADWNGRQYPNAVDELSIYGNNAPAAVFNYELVNGEPHPPILLGWGMIEQTSGGLWGYYMTFGGNAPLVQPIDFETAFGNFRLPNSKGFHEYVGGRWYDDRFWAPGDTLPFAAAEAFFDDPCEFVPTLQPPVWSSYCTSPVALLDPDVMRSPSAGGFQNPFSLPTGFLSPPLSAALYPDLKTHMLEHNWVQNPPADNCNPAFEGTGTFDGCEPYYFNLGIESSPATLFYDGHVRLLPNTEVQASDEQVLAWTGGVDGLWSRDTPLGSDGYFLQSAFDGVVNVSHHVLTTEGIFGRDTLGSSVAPIAPISSGFHGQVRGRARIPKFIEGVLP